MMSTSTPEYGLDRFGDNRPVGLEIPVEGVLIEYELAEALLEGGQGDEAVRERNSYVPADGRVGKVALQP